MGGSIKVAQHPQCQQQHCRSSSNTSFILDDERIIAHLENECLSISVAMSKLRKCTPEWFLLETRLKNAREEWEAAKEDRDLHCGFLGDASSSSRDSRETPNELGNVVKGSSQISNRSRGVDEGAVKIDVPKILLLNDNLGVAPGMETEKEEEEEEEKEKPQQATYDHIRGEYARVENELQKLPKFSPDWFLLKEELVELHIQLNDYANDEEEETLDKPCQEVNVDNSFENRMILYPSSPLTHSPPQQTFEGQQGSISPYPTISSGSNNSIPSQQHCVSPYHSMSNGSKASPSSRKNSCKRLMLGGDNLKIFNSNYGLELDEDEKLSQTVRTLKQQHENVSKELHQHQQFSKQWFDLKTKMFMLEDRLREELDQRSITSSGESSNSYNPTNTSYMSGWSSGVWSESEEEVMSYADDFECCMVAEALKQQSKDYHYHDQWENHVNSHVTDSFSNIDSKSTQKNESEYNGGPIIPIPLSGEENEEKEEFQKCMSAFVEKGKQQCQAEQGKRTASAVAAVFSSKRCAANQQLQEEVPSDFPVRMIQAVTRGSQQKVRYQRALLSIRMIQRAWRVYHCEKHLQQQENLEKKPLLNKDVAAKVIQACWRQHRCRKVFQNIEESVINIQSFIRKLWLATGKVYTDIWDVLFYSTALGIRLQRGKDGFVRIISVIKVDKANATGGSSIVRKGDTVPGSIVLEADGIDLQSPITKQQWGDFVLRIRQASRPMKFVVVSVPRQCDVGLTGKHQSVTKIQRIWRVHYCSKRLQATIAIQSSVRRFVSRCQYNRKLGNSAVSAACEDVQLEILQAASIIQLYARQWLAFTKMKSQKRRYVQTLGNVILIQCIVRGWLVRRIHPEDRNFKRIPLADSTGKQVPPISMEVCKNAEKQELLEKTNSPQHRLLISRKQNERNESSEKRKEFENDVTSSTISCDEIELINEITSPKRSIIQISESSARSWAQKEGLEAFEDEENEPAHSVARMRKVLEAKPCVPIFPQNEVKKAKRTSILAKSPQAPVVSPEVRAGNKLSPKNELCDVNVASRKKNFEKYDSPEAACTTPTESTQKHIPREKVRPIQGKEKNPTKSHLKMVSSLFVQQQKLPLDLSN